jgi:hypothetical protein
LELLNSVFADDAPSGVPKAFPLNGLAQQGCRCSERRKVVARRKRLDEVRKLLAYRLIGKSTAEGVKRTEL